MKAWGVRPNQLSYNTVMDAYARKGRVKDVLRVFNSMKVMCEDVGNTPAWRLSAHRPTLIRDGKIDGCI